MKEITLDTSTGILDAVESHLFWHTDYDDIQMILQGKDIEVKLENYNSLRGSFSITTNMYVHYKESSKSSMKMSVTFVKGENGHRFIALTDIGNSGCRYLFNDESLVQSIISNSRLSLQS